MLPAAPALALYTGLLGLIGIWLMVNTGKKKEAAGISIGDGGIPRVVRAMRGQMNFVENALIGIIILIVAALIGTPIGVIHAGGAMLVLGRFLHALHFTQDDAPQWQRAAGMLLTLIVVLVGSIGLVGHGLYALF